MPAAPLSVVLSFVEGINRGDVQGLGWLMTEGHELKVFDEAALVGRDANLAAWRGYVEAYPHYVIYPHRVVERRGEVAIRGHTTGSHLGLTDEEERQVTLIWLAQVVEGMIHSWSLVQDTAANRQRFGLDAAAGPTDCTAPRAANVG